MIRFPVYLFDVDGTLLDSAADICGAVRAVLDRNGCNHQSEEFLRSYIGRHLIDLFTDTVPGIDQRRMDALIADYRTTYLGRGHASTRVFPGVAEALSKLPGRKATATPKAPQPRARSLSSSALRATSITCRVRMDSRRSRLRM